MGTLYLVSTPIGNLEDITLRGLRILREVSLIAAEDTRHTKRLLAHYDIQTPSISYHEHNKLTRLHTILAALANSDVALVSDAGTPALSDPGFELVQACLAANFSVSPIPGPSAPIAALVASGLPTDRFFYLGFLPRKSSERRTFLKTVASISATLICFEAPHRLLETLKDLLLVLGDRQIVAARELTKLYEELVRTKISQALEHFKNQAPRGEFTLVIEGLKQDSSTSNNFYDEELIIQKLQTLHTDGQSGSFAARIVSKELNLTKSVVYAIWLKLYGEES